MPTTRAHWPYVVLLIALPFVVYANGYDHAFQLDDNYTITSNPSVRSLRMVPAYFVDPGTYTTLREQADYRPVLQLTYALNYRVGHYDMRWWHFTQIVLHSVVVVGLYALCLAVLRLSRDAAVPRALANARPEHVAFVAAAIVAVHPASAGVVDYINARSSLLTAALLVPALVAYMHPSDTPQYGQPQRLTAVLYALAIFTKVEAVGALGAFWAFDLWQRGREQPEARLSDAIRASFDRRTLARLTPALVVTVLYFIIRAVVMEPFPFADARHSSDIGASQYLATQLTAWWYYIARWIAPVRLVADNLAYPVHRSWLDPEVLLAAGGWIAAGGLLVAAWKRAPYLLFLAVASLALLSPTSSVAPLAEMVNEHRPYLPIAILSLAGVIPAGSWILARARGSMRTALATSIACVCLSLCILTWRRNEVFATPTRFWTDVVDKAPSSRAHLNLGVALMEHGDIDGALREMRRSLELAPYWYYTHINLAVAYQYLGRADSARAYYDRAVQYDRYSGLALTWRGEYRLAQRDYAGARDDFLASMPVGLQRDRNATGLATANAGLGADSTTSITLASADAVDAEVLMARGIDLLYTRHDPLNAAAQFRLVLQRNAAHYGATYQLATALDHAGQPSLARPYWVMVLDMATASKDARTAETARARLAR